MPEFTPHMEILPDAQRRLWPELSAVPAEFVLYGGTAIALRLGHRHSVDFDFFANRPLNLPELEAGISFLSGARITQREKNTLTAVVERGARVQVSFFGVPNLPRLQPASVCQDNGLRVASLVDLAGTKASVLQMRAEAKDYIDMDALMSLGKIDLPTALSAAVRLYGATFNPEITLKALSYFDDGNLRSLPDDMKDRLVIAAREVDLERLPEVGYAVRSNEIDYGL